MLLHWSQLGPVRVGTEEMREEEDMFDLKKKDVSA